MKKRILSALLCVAMLVSLLPLSAFAADSLQINGVKVISKYGNIKLNSTLAAVFAAFDYGDVVTVSFGTLSLDLPLCANYSDVDAGASGLFVREDGGEEEVTLAINHGDFAQTYGVATKVTVGQGYEWQYNGSFSETTVITVTLKEKAGYLQEYTLRSISYTDERGDYPNLTDAQFANFRNVRCGHIGANILYRSATPVEPIHNRNTYADACAKQAGVTHFINVAESEETLTAYKGYAQTYYATVNHIAVAATVDFSSAETKAAFARAFRYMAENKGIYDVHCREGKDRTGIMIAVLECLMGVSYEEICADYMVTYYNYYGITEKDAAYDVVLQGTFVKALSTLFGADLQGADLKKEATDYLKEIGLTKGEILNLKANLYDNSLLGRAIRLLADLQNGFIRLVLYVRAYLAIL